MTNQMLTFHHQTRIVVNIIIEDDTGMLAFSILLVTYLFTLFWRVSQFISTIQCEWSQWIIDFKTAFDFTAKVFAISFNSLAYGLGAHI